MLPPRKKYTTEYIKEAILAFEDLDTVKIKVKKKSRRKNSNLKVKTLYHTFNRREYMRWWSSEFHAYRDAVGDGLAKGHVMRKLQLDAVAGSLKRGAEMSTACAATNNSDEEEKKDISGSAGT